MSPTVRTSNSWLEKALKHVYLVMLRIKFESFLSHVFPFHTPFVMIKCLHSWEGKLKQVLNSNNAILLTQS